MALIVLADDDDEVRLSTKLLLEEDGHQCMDFSDGDEALKGLRNIPGVDLVIIDIFMPFSNGRDLVNILRKGPPKFKKLPVILISGVFPEKTFRLHTEDPKCKFLKKPFTGELFRKTVNSML